MAKFRLPKRFKNFKTFDQRLKDGELCDLKAGAAIAGFSEQHMRRLCSGPHPIAHIRRNGTEIFFKPQHIRALFSPRG